MKKYFIISTNCDCCSDIVARTENQINRWVYGPLCPGCNKILGLMQWGFATTTALIANDEMAALQQYRNCFSKIWGFHGTTKEIF